MKNRTHLFFLSVFILYIEILLIRWIGTEINIFAYLQNTILVCCFLGLGMGCLAKTEDYPLRLTLLNLAVFTVLLSFPPLRKQMLIIASMLSSFHDFLTWQSGTGGSVGRQLVAFCLGTGITFVLAGLIWQIMVPLGAQLARLLNSDPHPVQAYTVNILGSILGVWLFSAMAWLSISPAWWFIVLGLLALPLARSSEGFGSKDYSILLLVAFLPMVGSFFEPSLETRWSPYQKLDLTPDTNAAEPHEYYILVNNAGYQSIQNNSVEIIKELHPELVDANGILTQYDVAGRIVPDAKEILVVGAGSGNDVAGALRTTQGHITAVEIDPVIVDFGKHFHPEKPYDSPRVTTVIDDARAFFIHAQPSFDLIIFGLLDSHTTPALTTARLDHYVYTLESLRSAARLLNPNGVLVLIFQPQRRYVGQRLAKSLTQVFGRPPLTFAMDGSATGWGGLIFVSGNQEKIDAALASDQRLAQLIQSSRIPNEQLLQSTVMPTVDNWPYLYLEGPEIPALFYVLAIILVLLWRQSSKRVLKGVHFRSLFQEGGMFFAAMGAGFSFFQVFGVNQAAILFGSSWIVNSIVISAILIMILIANFVQQRLGLYRVRVPILGVLLFVMCLLYVLNFSDLIHSSGITKALLVLMVFGGPMFLSGLCFASAFEQATDKGRALGANLFGALVGGTLQLSTFAFGIKSLMILSFAAYVIALLSSSRVNAVDLRREL